jgi:isoquinoline 1-oxidoreductase subunit alpha
MTAVTLNVNGEDRSLDAPPEMPLLWAVRDLLGLTGTKFGCGAGLCGACTVHVDGKPVRSCSAPISGLGGKKIVTIEGLAPGGPEGGHPVQRAWIAEGVPQCGYCQSGQIMTAVALLAEKPAPTDADIEAAMTNICRCGTYQRIRRAIHRAAAGDKA